jgi:glycosyltransferase involved in cell wall biosynthesis
MTSVKWEGPLLIGSGYSEAARNYIGALSRTGVAITTKLTEPANKYDYGRPGRIVEKLLDNVVNYKTKVISASPEYFIRCREPGRYNIGLFFWEADRLPEPWVDACDLMDELWVPCEWLRKVCLRSGVTRPISVVPPCLDALDLLQVRPFGITGLDVGAYKFYSIFEWTTRKNPEGLIRAYASEFSGADKVVLILKTFQYDYSPSQQERIHQLVKELLGNLNKPNPPRIILDLDFRSRDEILWLHSVCDCFVLPHRGEGWGFPHFEACAMGKPVITTAFGANMEFTKNEHSYLLDFKMIPVRGMSHNHWYSWPMNWANPNEDQLRRLMRHVYENRSEAAMKGLKARNYIIEHFNWEIVGRVMLEALKKAS